MISHKGICTTKSYKDKYQIGILLCQSDSMEKEVHPTIKLKELRNRAGYTIRALGSELKYKTSNNYAFYEDATRFKKKLYPLEFVLKLSKVFVGKGDPPISRIEVLSLSGLDELTAEEFSEMRPVPEAPLVGEVLAGHYVLEEGRSKKPEEFIPIASDKRYPDNIPRLVYRVGDDSADERFAKGSYIVCIKAQELARP
ncbi:MAG: hypothetical protein ABJP25_11585, partial [Sneathiella sp.]